MLKHLNIHLVGSREALLTYQGSTDQEVRADDRVALACRGQDRVLGDPDVGDERTDTDRAGLIRQLKQSGDVDLSVGGAELGGQALAAGLVDEIQLFLGPVIVGGGKRALPAGMQARLRLIGARGFAGGVVYARYAVDD